MPNRIIKESICRSDSIDSLSWFEEVLFYRLIVVCDDYGRFDGRPAVVKGFCFPLKDDITKKQIADALEKLSTVGLVRGYEVCGKSFLQLTAWEKHQQIRAKNSKYPAPETPYNQMISDDITCPRESIYENRESYSRNGDARAIEPAKCFEEFLLAYPIECNRHLTEQEYASLLLTGGITEEELVSCAKNYAEACKIQEIPERYIKYAENFLKEFVFEKYLPGKYVKPVKAKNKPKNSFCNFQSHNYDISQLEKALVKGSNPCQ